MGCEGATASHRRFNIRRSSINLILSSFNNVQHIEHQFELRVICHWPFCPCKLHGYYYYYHHHHHHHQDLSYYLNERENWVDQSKLRTNTCSTCKTKTVIKAFSTRLCETHHKLAMDGSLEKWWREGGRGGGKKLLQTKLPEKKNYANQKWPKKYPYRRRVNLRGIKTSNNKARFRLLNLDRNYDRMCGTVDPATKNLNLKNLLGKSLPVKPPLYKNLCSLKFKTGSYFLKSMKKCFTLGK